MHIDSLVSKNFNYTELPACPSLQRKEGTPLLKLNANENQMGTSTAALGAMIKTAAQVNTYPEDNGEELREKIAKSAGLDKENIVIDSGLLALIQHITEVFVSDEDEVLISALCPEDISVLFKQKTKNCIEIPLMSGGEQDLKTMRDAVTEKTKLVFLANPYNPTGAIIKNTALEAFLCSLPQHVICVIDETYLDFADAAKYKSAEALANECNIIVCHSFSAAYGLAGNGIAYAAAPKDISSWLRAAVPMYSVSKIALAAASAAYDDSAFVKACVDEVRKNIEYMKNELKSLRFKPFRSQANFIYTQLPESVDADKLNEYLISKGIFIKRYPNAYRITIGTGWQCEYVVNSIKEFLGYRK